MFKLSFIGLGTQKAGTTTLHNLLKQHPDVFLPDSKEAHFFNKKNRFERGVNWLEESFFQNRKHEKCLGKFTPDYLAMLDVPNRIYEYLGDTIKFIVVLRNPVNRAISHYAMSYRKGHEHLLFNKAIEQEAMRISKSESDFIKYAYIEKGFYGKQLNEFFKIFSRDNFLILVFEEDIIQNLPLTLRKIEAFLGIAPYESYNFDVNMNQAFSVRVPFINQFLNSQNIFKLCVRRFLPNGAISQVRKSILNLNKSKKNKKSIQLTSEEKKYLMNIYSSDIQLLSEICGREFNVWK